MKQKRDKNRSENENSSNWTSNDFDRLSRLVESFLDLVRFFVLIVVYSFTHQIACMTCCSLEHGTIIFSKTNIYEQATHLRSTHLKTKTSRSETS